MNNFLNTKTLKGWQACPYKFGYYEVNYFTLSNFS